MLAFPAYAGVADDLVMARDRGVPKVELDALEQAGADATRGASPARPRCSGAWPPTPGSGRR